MADFAVGVIGAGAIGRAHVETILASGFSRLAGIADPAPGARDWAASLGVPWFADYRDLLAAAGAEAMIIATPNDLHLSVALDCLAAGLPCLVEKPVAATVADGEALAAASEAAGVAVLVGHHRRHNGIIQTARRLIGDGAIGAITAGTVLYTFRKPDDYFSVDWRLKPGTGGPVLINLIHEIDLIRFLCGEIRQVQAAVSTVRRGRPVEDTAAVLLTLENGALITLTLSDTVCAPWSWDLAAGESAHYPPQPDRVHSHFLAGTEGALTLPTLDLWSYPGKKSWFEPLDRKTIATVKTNPYLEQLRHLQQIVRGGVAPIISAADGTRTLRATLAVHEAAATGRPVVLAP